MSVSVRVERMKSDRAEGLRSHDMRLGRVPKYVDQTRSEDNSIILEPLSAHKLEKECESRRSLRVTKRKMKRNINVGIAGIITFSAESQSVIRSLPAEDQNRLYLETAERIARRFNTTLTGLVAHRDEKAPHAHFQMPAFDLSGSPLSNSMGPAEMKEIQDIAGEVFGHLGIRRGIPKSARLENGDPARKIFHKTVRELHETEELDAQERLREEVLGPESDPYDVYEAVFQLAHRGWITATDRAPDWAKERIKEIEESYMPKVTCNRIEAGDESLVPLDKLFDTPQVVSEPEKFSDGPSEKEGGLDFLSGFLSDLDPQKSVSERAMEAFLIEEREKKADQAAKKPVDEVENGNSPGFS